MCFHLEYILRLLLGQSEIEIYYEDTLEKIKSKKL